MKVIFVEGNIGAGKTEFLKAMQGVCDCQIVPEPVPHKFLEKLYNDPEAWAYPFQLIMATERKIAQDKALMMEAEGDFVFLERSLHADSLFAKIAIRDPKELKKYQAFREEVLGGIIAKPDLIIYLRSMPSRCLQRIRERMWKDSKRECERTVSLEYLQNLHLEHDKWLCENNEHNVLIVDTELNDWRQHNVAKRLFNNIVDKLKTSKRRQQKHVNQWRLP